jgi:hypothetical protein
VQSGLSYTFAPGGWVALNAGYFKGGRTTVDDVESEVELQGIRFGATLVLPVNRHRVRETLQHQWLQPAS